jgi:uncharacterized protein
MQILTISDEVVPAIYSLNIKQRFQRAELVLSCGDLPIYYLEFVVTMLGRPCYYVFGNHDGPEETSSGQTLEQVSGAISVDGRTTMHNGLLLAGLGGSIRYKPQAAHQFSEAEMMRRVYRLAPALLFNRLRHGRYVDIFLTHAPPLGIHNGPDYPHRGFQSFLWLMDRFQPRYLIHGHIHLSYGFDRTIETRYKGTTVINTAGYRVMDYHHEVG